MADWWAHINGLKVRVPADRCEIELDADGRGYSKEDWVLLFTNIAPPALQKEYELRWSSTTSALFRRVDQDDYHTFTSRSTAHTFGKNYVQAIQNLARKSASYGMDEVKLDKVKTVWLPSLPLSATPDCPARRFGAERMNLYEVNIE